MAGEGFLEKTRRNIGISKANSSCTDCIPLGSKKGFVWFGLSFVCLFVLVGYKSVKISKGGFGGGGRSGGLRPHPWSWHRTSPGSGHVSGLPFVSSLFSPRYGFVFSG